MYDVVPSLPTAQGQAIYKREREKEQVTNK